MTAAVTRDALAMGAVDLHLFHEGTHPRLGDKLGSRAAIVDGVPGTWFAVWAPNAGSVSVLGDFNGWRKGETPLDRGEGGVFAGFVPGVGKGERYKYHLVGPGGVHRVDKADPFAVRQELPPGTASVIWDLEYAWQDDAWIREQSGRPWRREPMSIYEVHLGSWMRLPEEDNRWFGYAEIAPKLIEHVRRLGFTHVELMPVMEHPFYGSWGYETTGYFAPTARYGTAQDLMQLVDRLHQAGIGVILDWVPAHFPSDEHGLAYFDGTHLFEHADRRRGFHPEWNTSIFDYGRAEVRSFLISSAFAWIDRFHADGVRVDGVASMLYLDYARKEGEWVRNEKGGNENLEAIAFLRTLNETLERERPDVVRIAEESTAFPMVTRSPSEGGLGFGLKWDLGWMNDTLKYLARDPVHRRWHHNELTMRGLYAASEAFVLPLSHDEVTHGKGSLLGKMSGGDFSRRLANLRLLFAYMYSQPGKKLLFMGSEIAPWSEWNHDASLDWHLTAHAAHERMQLFVGELNRLYREEPCLHELDCDGAGFRWIDADDAERSILAYERLDAGGATLIVILNFTPTPRTNYRVGVPLSGVWEEILNSDAEAFGGSRHGNLGEVEAGPRPAGGHPLSLVLTLPPLGALFLRRRAPVLR
ncbi:MAG: 1,4-alpha-glucan branching protein GlgB [Byssovorax sp.]